MSPRKAFRFLASWLPWRHFKDCETCRQGRAIREARRG